MALPIVDSFLQTSTDPVVSGTTPHLTTSTFNASGNSRMLIIGTLNTANAPPGPLSIESLSLRSSTLIDPITITIKALNSMTQVAKTLRRFQKIALHHKLTNLSLSTLHTQCVTACFELRQIKALLERDADGDGDGEVGDRFDCNLLLDFQDVLELGLKIPVFILTKLLDDAGFDQTNAESSRDEVSQKLQQVTAHEQMSQICRSIKNLARELDLFYTAFQAESRQQAADFMQSRKAKELVELALSDAISIASSVREGDRAENSERVDVGEDISEIDAVLMNSALYQKAYANHAKLMQREGGSSEVNNSGATDLSGAYASHARLMQREGGSSEVNNSGATDLSGAYASHARLMQREEESSETNNLGATDHSGLEKQTVYVPFTKQSEPEHKGLHALHSDEALSPIEPTSTPINHYFEPSATNDAATSPSVSMEVEADSAASIVSTDSEHTITQEQRGEKPGGLLSTNVDSPLQAPDSGDIVVNRLPTLYEVLARRTSKPYTLFEFYIYMREVQRSVDYLDFWLDCSQHLQLCRLYVRALHKEFVAEDSEADVLERPSQAVRREDLRASAEKILYTYLLPGSERELVLPQSILAAVQEAIEEDKRDDPEIFDDAKHYCFLAMENDAFPGFLNLSRLIFRPFRRSNRLGLLVNRLSGVQSRSKLAVPKLGMDIKKIRIPPEQLFGTIG